MTQFSHRSYNDGPYKYYTNDDPVMECRNYLIIDEIEHEFVTIHKSLKLHVHALLGQIMPKLI